MEGMALRGMAQTNNTRDKWMIQVICMCKWFSKVKWTIRAVLKVTVSEQARGKVWVAMDNVVHSS